MEVIVNQKIEGTRLRDIHQDKPFILSRDAKEVCFRRNINSFGNIWVNTIEVDGRISSKQYSPDTLVFPVRIMQINVETL